MAFVECVPNISEGRRTAVVDALASVVLGARGVHLLDRTSDSDHNRSVFTLAGAATDLQAAILALFDGAIRNIDMRTHRGVHPRVGAVDVVPFVPVGAVSMSACIALARDTAAEVARRFPGVREVFIQAHDGTKLHAWLAQGGEATGELSEIGRAHV